MKLKFPCCERVFLSSLLFLGIVLLAGSVAGGVTKESAPKPSASFDFLQAKVKESAKLEMQRISRKQGTGLGVDTSSPRTLGVMDRVLDSIGMNSMTWVPGLRSLLDMNTNGTQMEFIPLGRLLWRRFFGDGPANTLLGL